MKKENWYFLIALVVVLACMVGTLALAHHYPRLAYAVGFIMGIIVTKFFILTRLDARDD